MNEETINFENNDTIEFTDGKEEVNDVDVSANYNKSKKDIPSVIKSLSIYDMNWKSGEFPLNTTTSKYTSGVILSTFYFVWVLIALWLSLEYTILAITGRDVGGLSLWLFFILMGNKFMSIVAIIVAAHKGIPWLFVGGMISTSFFTFIEIFVLFGGMLGVLIASPNAESTIWFLFFFGIKTIIFSFIYLIKMVKPHKEALDNLRIECKINWKVFQKEKSETKQENEPLVEVEELCV